MLHGGPLVVPKPLVLYGILWRKGWYRSLTSLNPGYQLALLINDLLGGYH